MRYDEEDSATWLRSLIALIVTFSGSVAVSIYVPGMIECLVQLFSATFFIVFIEVSGNIDNESLKLFRTLILMAIFIIVAIYHMVFFAVIVCLVLLYLRLSS